NQFNRRVHESTPFQTLSKRGVLPQERRQPAGAGCDGGSEVDDRADALAFFHQFEGLVDVFQTHGVGDEGAERNVALLRLLHIAWQLAATLHATKGTAAPDPASDHLERTGDDFLPSAAHTNDARLAPAPVAAFQCRTHQLDVADTRAGVVHTTVGHVDDHLLARLV